MRLERHSLNVIQEKFGQGISEEIQRWNDYPLDPLDFGVDVDDEEAAEQDKHLQQLKEG